MSLQLGANKVPASQAAAPPGQSTLTGEELLQTQNPCIYVCRVALVVSSSLLLHEPWPSGYSVSGVLQARIVAWVSILF